MRWTLSAMLLAVAIVASGLGVYHGFWEPSDPNVEILLAAFLMLICLSATAAVFGRSMLRGAFFGVALFGTAYLICVLHGGFDFESYANGAEWLARHTKIGFALLGVSFLASQLIVMTARPNAAAPSREVESN
ncbi:MAG TPA: hypothetical protein VMV10_30955 [Pirellulales bacterium]|nr:hypothetical protein [Pirellulales bacterium]